MFIISMPPSTSCVSLAILSKSLSIFLPASPIKAKNLHCKRNHCHCPPISPLLSPSRLLDKGGLLDNSSQKISSICKEDSETKKLSCAPKGVAKMLAKVLVFLCLGSFLGDWKSCSTGSILMPKDFWNSSFLLLSLLIPR
jgi:hypothetical protein